jgi:hypothetical protein
MTAGLVHRLKQHKAVLLYSEVCPGKSEAAKRKKRSRDGVVRRSSL